MTDVVHAAAYVAQLSQGGKQCCINTRHADGGCGAGRRPGRYGAWGRWMGRWWRRRRLGRSAHVGGWGGAAAMHSVAMGHMTGPRVQSMGMSPNHFAWGRDHFHDRFHHRFHNRFFAFGFGGPYLYDYAYNSCWTRVPTRYGWHWVYVCGDNAY